MTIPPHWAADAIFYHIYPPGFCGAPPRNDFSSPPVDRLRKISGWLPHLQQLGINALYLGPVFESSAHGYDTADYYQVDRRLGDTAALSRLAGQLKENGIRLVLDGVFNHVGRDFWAFRDVQSNREASPYCDWFRGLRFDARSPYGDPFSYEAWNGHYDLVRLNLAHPAVREHLFEAIRSWVLDFDIAGLRLDAADSLDFDFLRALQVFCRGLKPDFWLMGEVVHGDYRDWVNPKMLDSVTNYEAYKGLYSSLSEENYFEIAYTLQRQFGPGGLYKALPLYNFADNHDVDRVASRLGSPARLYPLYLLLFTMPGSPSIYYGSEWGLEAKRTPQSDAALRPCLELDEMPQRTTHPNLAADLARLAELRTRLPALRHGDYNQLHVSSHQLVFSRTTPQQSLVVMLNAAGSPAALETVVAGGFRRAVDVLNGDQTFSIHEGRLGAEIPAGWGRVLLLED
mgnify:CR=1 FL=1